jgi:cobyrinic acid a,c-diamide synthase
MVGFIQADTVVHASPQARGLVVLEETDAFPWPKVSTPAGSHEGDRLPAHEFHHAALQDLEPGTRFGYRVTRGHGIDGQHDGIVKNNVLASFCHLRSTERSGCWTRRFVEFVRAHRQNLRSRGG